METTTKQKRLQMTWKDTVTDFSANIFTDIPSQYSKHEIGKYEPSPNMLLQMFLFFNVFLFPFWTVTSLTFLYVKFHCLGSLTQFLSVTVFIMVICIECIRLYLGYLGNLSEKIPELAGFWMLSILLQLPLHTFLISNPYLEQRPIELTLDCIIWLLLFAQLISGFFALKTAAARAKQFYILRSHLRASPEEGDKKNL